jgi:hypothetical protein
MPSEKFAVLSEMTKTIPGLYKQFLARAIDL